MARYARKTSGLVVEIIDLPDGLTPGVDILTPEIAETLALCPDTKVVEGWTYDGKDFTAPSTPEPTVTVPTSVTSAQAKIQLLRTPGSADGKTLLDDVKAGIDAAGGEVEIWFTDARTWERTNPYVAQLGKSLKLKAADIDALFVAAAQIAA